MNKMCNNIFILMCLFYLEFNFACLHYEVIYYVLQSFACSGLTVEAEWNIKKVMK